MGFLAAGVNQLLFSLSLPVLPLFLSPALCLSQLNELSMKQNNASGRVLSDSLGFVFFFGFFALSCHVSSAAG